MYVGAYIYKYFQFHGAFSLQLPAITDFSFVAITVAPACYLTF